MSSAILQRPSSAKMFRAILDIRSSGSIARRKGGWVSNNNTYSGSTINSLVRGGWLYDTSKPSVRRIALVDDLFSQPKGRELTLTWDAVAWLLENPS